MTTKNIVSNTDTVRIYIKRVLRLARNIFLRKEKRSIIFDACEKFHYFHLESIIKKISQNKNFRITIIMWSDFKDNDRIPGVTYISFDNFWHDWFNQYDILISTELERRPGWFVDGTAICMFHGAGPKMSYIKNPAINDYDIIFSVGSMTYDVQKEFADSSVTIEKIGLPITDKLLLDKSLSSPKNINIDPSKPTLLYAPSWSLATELISMDDEILEALTAIEGYNVIIRPHPNLLIPEKCNNKDWSIKFKELKKSGIQISYSKDHSAYDLLPHIDILIGDISSVTYEFLILDRPIILYMKNGILNAFDAEDFITPLLSATTRLEFAQDLTKTVEHISNHDVLSTERKNLLNKTLFNIGTATDHALESITKLSK
jgi:CDP-Glycerol:Poly(glycerophosphate) glycerophosphotransferase